MSGIDWAAQQRAMRNWVIAGTGLSADKVVWGQQDAPRPAGPAILLRVSNIAEIGRSWLETEDAPLSFSPKSVSGVDTTADTLTVLAHGFATGAGPIHMASTGTLPAAVGGNITAGVDYWLIAPDANHLQLARTYADTGGGQGAGNPITPIDLTSAGSGAITISSTDDTRVAGAELNAISRGYLRVTLELRCHSAQGQGVDAAVMILQRLRTRRAWPTQQDILLGSNIGLIDVDRTRAIQGIRDALLFEPRAYCDVHLCVVAEEAEGLTIITSAEVTDTTTGHEFVIE